VAIAKTLTGVLIVLQGESLVNDGTALIVLGFAVPARRRGGLVPGVFFREAAFSNAPASGRPMGRGLPAGHRRPAKPIYSNRRGSGSKAGEKSL
jgi:hypothetical protein